MTRNCLKSLFGIQLPDISMVFNIMYMSQNFSSVNDPLTDDGQVRHKALHLFYNAKMSEIFYMVTNQKHKNILQILILR